MNVAAVRAPQMHSRLATEGSLAAAPRRRRRAPWILTGLMLLGGLTLWESAHRVGWDATAGVGFNGGPIAAPDSTANGALPGKTTLRIGTFNIHGGKGLDNVRDLDRTANELKSLDIIGLNEIEGPFLFESRNQADELGERLKLPWLFAPAEQRWWHYDFGNGALSRLPIHGWQRIPLPRAYGKGFRNLVLLRTEFQGRPLHVVITHIDRSDDRERQAQLRFVGDLFLSLAEPVVLMGDMNSDGEHPEIRRLLDTPGVVEPLTAIHGAGVSRHIDWIFLRGLDVRDAAIHAAGPSDHPAVWAEVALSAAE